MNLGMDPELRKLILIYMDSIKESCMDGITEVGQGKGRSALHKLLSKGTHVDHQVQHGSSRMAAPG